MIEHSEKAIDVHLGRHTKGIYVKVKVFPEVEEFFKQWGGGVKMPPMHHRLWKTVNQNDGPLELWSFEKRLTQSSEKYDIISTGAGLISESTGYPNLSFIRLVGASEGEGREFIIESVISNPELESLSNRIGKAAERFYLEYIHPIHMRVYVGVLDTSRLPDGGR